MSLGGTVPKHSNTSRIRAQGMQNTSQKNSPNVTFGIHKKQQFYRPWDASPASKTIGKCPLEAQFWNTWTPAGFQPKGMQNTSQKNSANVTFTSGKCPLEAQFRNTRTPAGFEPKACKTQARKTLRTLPLESIKNNYSIAREMPLQLAKPLANVPWRHSSETLERQQDSSPRHAKHKPEKLCERYLYQWQMSLGGTVPKHSNTSRVRAQGMQNTSQKNSPNVTFKSIKNNYSIAREMPLQLAKPLANVPWRHSSEVQFRNTRTPAGFEPKACKTQARKTLRTLPLESIKKQQFYRPWDASPASKTIGKCPLGAQFRNTRTPAGFEPKAQARKTLRTVPLESIKNNNSIAREMPLQQAKPLAMSLGGTGPKHSNATSTKWLSNLLGALPLARGVGGYHWYMTNTWR